MKSPKPTFYDHLSRWYDWIALGSEWSFVRACCDQLQIEPGGSLLEIGHGTGHALVYLAEENPQAGLIVGIDTSAAMSARARSLCIRSNTADQVRLVHASAENLPFQDGIIGVILMTFTLELFPEDSISNVISEIKRVLKPAGQVAIVSLHDRQPKTWMTKAYTALHNKLPAVLDCRPILAQDYLIEHGFEIIRSLKGSIWGLSLITLLATKT